MRPLGALQMASKRREFWILAGSFFICGASTNGLMGTHLIPACMDHGIAEVQAAGLLAMMGIFDLVGTTGSGWLSDRYDNRVLLCVYYGLRGLSLLYLPDGFVSEGHGLSMFAVFYGLDWIATVPPTVALARQAFGAEKTGLVFGWIMAAHQVGAALAASVPGSFAPLKAAMTMLSCWPAACAWSQRLGFCLLAGAIKPDLCLNRGNLHCSVVVQTTGRI